MIKDLLAIVIDRLEEFQEGPLACEENEDAIHHARMAMFWLNQRTLGRIERGVEGSEVA